MTGQPHRLSTIRTATCGLLGLLVCNTAAGAITDFNNWTLAEDPPHPNATASIDGPSQVTLNAVGPLPAATDIGYQSINANTADIATAGFAFDPTTDFSLAVDYDWSVNSAVGGSAIGFGLGEDGAGDQSAGVALAANSSVILGATGAARTNIGQIIRPITLGASSIGSMHILYNATTGNITVGTGTPGANAPSFLTTYAGADVYDLWNADADDDLLLVSLFIRSDDTAGPPLTAGSTRVVFSNLRLTSGTPIEIPEPSSLALLGLGGLLIARRRRA